MSLLYKVHYVIFHSILIFVFSYFLVISYNLQLSYCLHSNSNVIYFPVIVFQSISNIVFYHIMNSHGCYSRANIVVKWKYGKSNVGSFVLVV